ncbi:FAD-binding oxidoreductase [Alisedimentitalea sp. MJ-SS2]|uniref:NAD(P)/FAD-dependent oxidoreductase n=1 Tax=Aliisedimentitalea sp. MJ-SS2 TaxID=3049795 RepID=UPI0029141B9F|nr:FAD-binding oxidoreductase [Alisedimentitalea sp. MJ-SS2]MDU8926534.1 FAD-binding oxidoreductase [Alisedimentitalea sp. MJ-SS2]
MELITEPYWWQDGAELPPVCHDVPAKADMVVVGAGFTGLGAALAAAEKGAEVVVFDAGQPGQGASTRNGGMIGAPHRPEFVQELKTYGRDLAVRIVREGAEGYAHTRALHEASGVFQHTGRVQMAFTRAHFEAMAERVRLIHELAPQETRLLNREELQDHIRSDLYFGGLYYPDHGAVQPRLAHDGLMKRARDAGVTICAECAVTAMKPEGDGFRLTTEAGEIRARRLVWATNGYTGLQSRWLARRIFRVPSFIIATEELPEGVIDRLAPGRRMMVESRARHSYFRPSPDGKRIIFGGRAALVSIDEREAARRLQRTMAEIWPEAAEWKLSHSWQGWLGFTFARNPYVGSHEGVHFAYGYSGNGVALSPWLGRKAALRAMGDPEGTTAFAETRLESRPYHIGGTPWFMALASPWWRFVVDARETARARRDREMRR